jgi:hypothetical protein
MRDIEGIEHPDEITLDGVNYWLDWGKFRKGKSFIIPCLNIPRTRDTILTEMAKRGFAVETKVILVNDIRALRVWRI